MCASDLGGRRGVPRRVQRSVQRSVQRGLSIVEIMVGVVISLLVGLAATNSAVMFSAAQRQGIGSGGVTVNATTALAALKNDVTSAGLGFLGDGRLLCQRLNLSVGAVMMWDGATFSPVRVTREAAADRIDVLYGTNVEAGANVFLQTDSDGTDAALQSRLPVAAGQAVLLAPAAAGDPCVVRSVTATTAATETDPQRLSFANTGAHNAMAFTTTGAYPERSRITLLGDLRWNRYRLDSGNLILERPLEQAQAVLARNVIALRSQYGITAAAAGSTTLEDWQNAEGAGFAALDATTIGRVRALRVGIVTRSPQREKPGPSGECESSLAKPQLFGVEVEPDVSDWRCYRYRTGIVVIPLRNLVMGVRS